MVCCVSVLWKAISSAVWQVSDFVFKSRWHAGVLTRIITFAWLVVWTTHRDLFGGNAVSFIHSYWTLCTENKCSVCMSFCSDGDDYLQRERVLVDQFRQKNDPERSTEFPPWCYPLKERPLSPLRKKQKQGINTKCKNWINMNNKYLLS